MEEELEDKREWRTEDVVGEERRHCRREKSAVVGGHRVGRERDGGGSL